jgi:PAS domain-containing protein
LPAKDFESLLVESVDEALSSLGEDLKNAIYSYIQERFGISRREIPRNIDAFSRAIEEIPSVDAGRFKILILKQLYEKNGWFFRENEFSSLSFSQQLEQARGRMYAEFVSSMKTPVAIFHLEALDRETFFKLIAINTPALEILGVDAKNALGKTVVEVFPEISRAYGDVQELFAEVIRSGKPRSLGEFYSRNQQAPQRVLSAMAYLFTSDCVGLVFKNAVEPNTISARPERKEEPFKEDKATMGEWKWNSETIGRQILADRLHARERWIRRKITDEPRSAQYFSLRGRECLENGDLVSAREFFSKAEESYLRLKRLDHAFENASLRLKTYIFEEKPALQEYFRAVEEYTHTYADFSMHGHFLEILAYYSQWKGHENSEGSRFDDSRANYARAEEIFLILKQDNKALFNASRRVLTYKCEKKLAEYGKAAEEFFEKYRNLSASKHYKEVRAHYCSHEADKSEGYSKTVKLRSEAESLFLEINQREFAFENAYKLADLYSDNLYSSDEQAVRNSFDYIEKFFERYRDFSEHEQYRKRLAEFYLSQARALTSQLKHVLH